MTSDEQDPTAGPSQDGSSWQAVHDSMLEIMRAADEHFAGREPSDEELRAFIRDRLLAEGRSDEEADEILRDL